MISHLENGFNQEKSSSELLLSTMLNQSLNHSWIQQTSSSQYNPLAVQIPVTNNFSSVLNKMSWRKGKWIDEEGVYTKKLIEAFNSGWLKIPSGTTLRSFLAEQLSWYKLSS